VSDSRNGLGILDVLVSMGFDPSCRGKLVRHRHVARYDMEVLLREGWLELYQSYQRRPVFEKTDRLVSFIGTKGTWARFVGVYDVKDRLPARMGHMPSHCPYKEWKTGSTRYYKMKRDPSFADLEHRVVIDWGPSARSWHQRLSNKRIMEVLPPGQVLAPFEDYLGFSLSHRELIAVFEAPEAHKEWRARLSAVAGVYLIVAGTTGAQYVGSAHGEQGIWGRWQQYARTGHGGNKMLRDLCRRDPHYPDAFWYSVLQVLPKTFTRAEVLRWEARYKDKLGRRAVSLNMN